MRAGSLRHRAEILSLGADLAPASHGSRWVGIRAKDGADVQAASGLRTRAMVEVRARAIAELVPGRYLLSGNRLLHITSVRDPMGTGAEVVLSCDELIGQPGQYLPAGGSGKPCRVHLTHQAPLLDEMGQVTDYRTRAEVALVEVGRPQVDDQLHVGGQRYSVIAYAADSDDGVVRGLWLEAQPVESLHTLTVGMFPIPPDGVLVAAGYYRDQFGAFVPAEIPGVPVFDGLLFSFSEPEKALLLARGDATGRVAYVRIVGGARFDLVSEDTDGTATQLLFAAAGASFFDALQGLGGQQIQIAIGLQ